ncbi:purine-cytosine permease family protein [Roseiarcus fermentans]|uniref:purine-cytosine permease family protein n=1 Tax=Roseiarcus fermentans TaxID=1473586 RepID=UPI0014726DB9|nr:cytosine permease [Roseiarcus fermentans]
MRRIAGVPIENTHPSLITDGVAAEDQQLAVNRPFWVFFVLNIGIAPWLSGVIVAGMGLNLFQAAVVIVIGSLIGAALPATTALLGPQSGLPQIEVGRFAFGRVGNRLPAALNWIGAIGWDVIFNSLSAAAVVSLLGRYGAAAPLWLVFAGLVALQLFVGIWGHHLVQSAARATGVVLGVVFLAIGVLAVSKNGLPAVNGPAAGSPAVYAALLLVVSFSLTLAPYASDYTRYLPRATPSRQVFASVFGGLFIASALFFGFGYATAALIADPTPIGVMSALAGLAGPLAPLVLIAVALSSAPCNAVNDNSAAYCLISAGVRISRPAATIVGAALGFVACLLATDSFVAFFENFLFLFAHGIAPWAAILVVHWWMAGARREETPEGIGLGAVVFVVVTAASVALFSANSIYTGIASKLVGGADVGPYFGFVAAAIAYAIGLEATRARAA